MNSQENLEQQIFRIVNLNKSIASHLTEIKLNSLNEISLFLQFERLNKNQFKRL